MSYPTKTRELYFIKPEYINEVFLGDKVLLPISKHYDCVFVFHEDRSNETIWHIAQNHKEPWHKPDTRSMMVGDFIRDEEGLHVCAFTGFELHQESFK